MRLNYIHIKDIVVLYLWIHNFFRSNYFLSKPTTIWSGPFTSHILQKGYMNDLLGFPVTYNQTMLSPTNVVVYSNPSIGLTKNNHLILQRQSSNPQPGIYIQISALFEVYEILLYS